MTPFAKFSLDFTKPLIFLAPMEGVVDSVVRDLLTRTPSIDICVTEFVRVTQHLHSDATFYKYCPELHTAGKTAAGTPVIVQLLGSDPVAMSENAHKAVELGALGIDINFGCPAKTVNNHDGGAALLKTPERIFQLTDRIRRSVPNNVPVSVKIRLGFDHREGVCEIAHAVEQANASWLCVHARTKMDGYRPPAYWEAIAPLHEICSMPVIANGEIWTIEDYHLCRTRSRSQHVMIGRGLVSNPNLACEIRNHSAHTPWCQWKDFILEFASLSKNYRNEKYAIQRTKQLSKMMGQSYGDALLLLEDIKRIEDYEPLLIAIETHFAKMKESSLTSHKTARILPHSPRSSVSVACTAP